VREFNVFSLTENNYGKVNFISAEIRNNKKSHLPFYIFSSLRTGSDIFPRKREAVLNLQPSADKVLFARQTKVLEDTFRKRIPAFKKIKKAALTVF
jgi:hypothetical protein